MIRHDNIINSLMHGDVIDKLVQTRNIGISEARTLVSGMSFKEYRELAEASADIVPPSGKPLSPGRTAATKAPTQQTQAAPAQGAPGAPAAPGSTDPRGVQVRNPATGKMEWMQPTDAVSEDIDLARMRKLAGIKEDSSAGASCAGAIASVPAALGNVKRRQPTNEQPKEYTAKEAPKTIVGDTKPSQASGELSSNLAARGKKTASRINNGFKK